MDDFQFVEKMRLVRINKIKKVLNLQQFVYFKLEWKPRNSILIERFRRWISIAIIKDLSQVRTLMLHCYITHM